MTDDLVAFIRARLDEMEAIARALPPGPWRWEEDDNESLVGADGVPVLTSQDAEMYSSWITRHPAFDGYITRHDPARILRDVAARRQIVENYVKVCGYGHGGYTTRDEAYVLAEGALAKTVKILAAVHADHPDYQEAWRP